MIVLSANPTFDAPVKLNVFGRDEPVEVIFTFRVLERRRMTALLRMNKVVKSNWFQRVAARLQLCWRRKRYANALHMLDELISSWEVATDEKRSGFDVPYSIYELRVLLAEFPNAAINIFFAFLEGYREARLKN